MFVRWQRRASSAQVRRRSNKARWSAILAESVRTEEGPRQKHIAFLASIDEDELGERNARCRFWRRVAERLDYLGKRRVPPDERERIEAALALKVRRPTKAEYRAAPTRAH